MTDESIQAVIRGVTLRVPLHRDEETTRQIISEVDQVLKRIESESSVIDTQRFALQAAIEFAARLNTVREEQAEDTRLLVKALDRVASKLRDLITETQPKS